MTTASETCPAALLAALTPARPGQPLPPAVRSALEELFGTDFRAVRVHAESAAVAAGGARALAFGNDLHFAPGEYDPATATGWQVLGHELAHVVQQRCGRAGTRPRTAPAFVTDAALEAEADRAGEHAADLFATGRRPARPLHAGAVASPVPLGYAVQCLMALEAFKQLTNVTGPRNKIVPVDQALMQYHTMDGQQPRDYSKLLNQLKLLKQACQTYERERPDSGRLPRVRQLVREIAVEKTLIARLSAFQSEGDIMKQWDLLEAAQEESLRLKGSADFTRAKGDCHSELNALINAQVNKMRGNSNMRAAIIRDISELQKEGAKLGTPPELQAVISEVMLTVNVSQLDVSEAGPSASYQRSTDPTMPKYELTHMLNQDQGRKFRLGSLLHELTHVATAESYCNTTCMLSISPTATDDEMINEAMLRRSQIQHLIGLINSDSEIPGWLQSEIKSKAGYPIGESRGNMFDSYLKRPPIGGRMDPLTKARFQNLINTRGLNSELVEYDTVINQMTLWCHLASVPRHNATYTYLLSLTTQAYNQRANYRRTHPTITNPLTNAVIPRP